MLHTGYVKLLSLALLLPLVLIVSSCTFGEGPELILPESEDVSTDSANSESAATANNESAATANNESTTTTIDESTTTTNNESTTTPNGASVSNDPVQPQEVANTSTDVQVEDEQPAAPVTNSEAVEPAVVEPAAVEPAVIEPVAVDINNESQPASNQNVASDNIVRIPRTDTANAPIINGDTINYFTGTELLDGEWRPAAQSNSRGESLGINNYMFGNAEQVRFDSHHHWAAMHDGEYLYLLVVSDDDGVHFQDTNEARKLWKDDSVELFFDGNHSQLTDYDGVDDFHFTVNLLSSAGVPNSSDGSNPMISQSAQSATLPADFSFNTGPSQGPQAPDSDRGRKDIYEFRIKLSELNIQVGMPFGFEVQLNDDDDGGTRDTKWGWHHSEGEDSSNDFTWRNPSIMGTAVLLR